MTTTVPKRRAALLALGAALLLSSLAWPQAAYAAPPTNDDFAGATAVAGVPFSDTIDLAEATSEANEPTICSSSSNTAWYRFTPSVVATYQASTAGTSFAAAHVFRAAGPGFEGLALVGCGGFFGPTTFLGEPGTTYYVQVNGSFPFGGTIVTTSLDIVPPPVNDSFASATPVTSLPFTAFVDTGAATAETGEPIPSCGPGSPGQTVWYAVTLPTSRSVMIASSQAVGAAYTGGSLANLAQVACGWSQPFVLDAQAGTTYYVQLSTTGGFVSVSIQETPAPMIGMSISPVDPSVFDTVQFLDFSFDPAGIGITSRSWDLGDGTTSSEQSLAHRYAADGNYTVTLSIVTNDGRTASASTVLEVRTHDIAITRLHTPQNVRAGQTRTITVGMSNNRINEVVRVDLYRSVAGALGVYELVGSADVRVDARRGGGTTDVGLDYTFTDADAQAGKVTFKAVATILGARDALPADNEAIAPPTDVRH